MLDKITELSLKMRGLVIIALLAVVAYGIFAYRKMPVDAFPDISPVMVPVFVEAHGMAPEEVGCRASRRSNPLPPLGWR